MMQASLVDYTVEPMIEQVAGLGEMRAKIAATTDALGLPAICCFDGRENLGHRSRSS
jgi:hypothetical protein